MIAAKSPCALLLRHFAPLAARQPLHRKKLLGWNEESAILPAETPPGIHGLSGLFFVIFTQTDCYRERAGNQRGTLFALRLAQQSR